ncbi:MAG: ADP-glyceromanno-heptose 6-epimerase [Candidatus Kapaibacterium sp.]
MIVLTGGAGFIGSCMLQKLNNEGITDVLAVDHLHSGSKWKNLVGKRIMDYCHKEDFRIRLAAGEYDGMIDTFIHLGACTDTTERDADYLMDNNLSYSKEIADYALSNDVKLIYASSAATYGDGSQGYSDRIFDDLRPLNPYGLSKHLFDLWALDNEYDKHFTGFKFFNVFGPNEYHKGNMASMVFRSFLQIRDTGRVKLFRSYRPDYKDGEQKRDFIYIKDVVDVIWNAYKNPDISGIYNLGTGNARTWNDLATAVFKAMERPVDIQYIDMPPELVNQYQYFTEADTDKLMASGLAGSFTSLEQSIKDYVRNYLLSDWIYI